MVPAVVLYILCRLDVLPESPRFLYLVGKREEGYYNLLDMYDKEIWAFRRLKSAETHRKSIEHPSKGHQKTVAQELRCLSWPPEAVSLTSSPENREVKAGLETLHYSDATITATRHLLGSLF